MAAMEAVPEPAAMANSSHGGGNKTTTSPEHRGGTTTVANSNSLGTNNQGNDATATTWNIEGLEAATQMVPVTTD